MSRDYTPAFSAPRPTLTEQAIIDAFGMFTVEDFNTVIGTNQ